MKKIIYTLATALLLAGSLTSCDKKLDIDPVNTVRDELALNTSSDVEAALVGCYTGIQNVEAYGGYIQLMSDLLADDGEVTFVGTFVPPIQINRKVIIKDNGFVQAIWVNAYNVINRTNNVLANIDKLDTPAKRLRVEGEAKFIRSAMYFELVRLYAKDWGDGTPSANLGVPLVLTPTRVLDAASQVRRNTVAEVYAQVIADLTDAEAKMPVTSPAAFFFANKYVAAGMLARVYLQQGRFADAGAAANRVISANKYTLNPSYTDEFFSGSAAGLLPNSPEDIFAIQISAQSGRNELNTFYSIDRRGDISIEDKHTNLYGPTDERGDLFTTSGGQTYSNKYDDLYGNIKMMRLAEMYLIRAEANALTSKPIDALTDLNTVRAARIANFVPGVEIGTALTDAIATERRKELWMEGHRWFDLKRTTRIVQRVDCRAGSVCSLAATSNKWAWPIPQNERLANPNVTQNEGY